MGFLPSALPDDLHAPFELTSRGVSHQPRRRGHLTFHGEFGRRPRSLDQRRHPQSAFPPLLRRHYSCFSVSLSRSYSRTADTNPPADSDHLRYGYTHVSYAWRTVDVSLPSTAHYADTLTASTSLPLYVRRFPSDHNLYTLVLRVSANDLACDFYQMQGSGQRMLRPRLLSRSTLFGDRHSLLFCC